MAAGADEGLCILCIYRAVPEQCSPDLLGQVAARQQVYRAAVQSSADDPAEFYPEQILGIPKEKIMVLVPFFVYSLNYKICYSVHKIL